MSGLTYRDAGVDIAGADAFVSQISEACRSTFDGRVVPATDAFAGLVRAPVQGMSEPLIAAACDGVGTKLLVARAYGKYRGLGQDLVAMNVNDLLPVGARPLLFLDYLATGKLEPGPLGEVVAGAAEACRATGCVLLGGETAEMPGLYPPGEFDLAGFAVGVVDRARVPRGAPQTGDVVLGLPSSGVHSNGLSLARAALLERGGLALTDTPAALDRRLGDALLEPTRLYVNEVLALMDVVPIKRGAHVTGGGLLGRARKLAAPLGLRIDPGAYARPPIFDLIAERGGVEPSEMARTFNMGLGYLVVVDAADAERALAQRGADGWLRVGEVVDEPVIDLGYARA